MMIDKVKRHTFKGDLRERIILTALDAFQHNGIKSITMDDIAALLKISKRTLYEVFADKETLLRECIMYHQDVVQDALEDLVAQSSNVLEVILKCYQGSVEMYHKVDKRFFEDIKKYPRIHEMIATHKENDSKIVADFLQKGVEQGLFREDINFEIIHFLMREQMDLLMATEALKRFPFLEVYESIILTYLRGISTIEGMKELDRFITGYRKMQQENADNDKTS